MNFFTTERHPVYANSHIQNQAEPSSVKRLGEVEETLALLRNNIDMVEHAGQRLTGRLMFVQRSEAPAAADNSRPTPMLNTPLGNELFSMAERLTGLKNLLDAHADRLEI